MLVVLLLVAVAVSMTFGSASVSLSGLPRVWREILDGESLSTEATILWRLRLPRILLVCLTGGALAVAGAGYQGLFRNPLADPFVIGSASGAAFGVAIVVVTGLQTSLFGLSSLSLAGFVGALLAVLCVFIIAGRNRETPMVSLLLAGVALSTFLSACVSLLMIVNSEELYVIFGWLMGSFSGRSWGDLWAVTPLIVIGLLMMATLCRSLDVLAFGEETAATLGLGRKKFLILLLSAASLLTAAAVSAAGIIGFVGLICPHIARRLVGARHAVMIPASGLLGALLLLVADDLARTVLGASELPVGILTAMLGGPFFLFLLKTERGTR
ncbi:MAG: iron ABC transporter permease [Planctomycetaceae bacterium]|nr:iron ABC transporter permease [Planctomycetaceae bacterium]